MTSTQRQSAGNVLTVIYRAVIGIGVVFIGWVGNAYYEAQQKSNDRVIAAIGEATDTANGAAATIRVLQAQFGNLSVAVKNMTDDRYTARDAARDFQIRDQKDVEQDRRLGAVEDRLRTWEPSHPVR